MFCLLISDKHLIEINMIFVFEWIIYMCKRVTVPFISLTFSSVYHIQQASYVCKDNNIFLSDFFNLLNCFYIAK